MQEITCDGCLSVPIIGWRYRCTKCKDSQGNLIHDICTECYDDFMKGNYHFINKDQNPMVTGGASNDAKNNFKNHVFEALTEAGSFVPMNSGEKKVPKKNVKKIKPNDKCPCDSGKKYKKCCKAKDDIAAAAN
jgi:hypothetical protein